LKIRNIQVEDWSAILEIYKQGLTGGIATFETDIPNWKEWDNKYLKACRLLAYDESGTIMAWATLSPISQRPVYNGVTELSIYVADHYKKRGIGTKLLQALIMESEKQGIWTLQSHIFKENHISIKLHAKCGFRQVGYRERYGQINGQWKDVVLMERRSHRI
jgi:phosphinothricin acetyltransferase